jgi:hypothetical protein
MVELYRKMRMVWTKMKALLQRRRSLRIVGYFIVIPILLLISVVLYAVSIISFESETWQFTLLAWMSILAFIIFLIVTFFCIFKLMKELGLKICIIIFSLFFLLDVYANFKRVSIYQKLPYSLQTSAQMATNDTINNGKALIKWGPSIYENLYLTATGRKYMKYIDDSIPMTTKTAGFDVIAECVNITFTKPYTVGQKGRVEIWKEYDQNYSSIVLYEGPTQISDHTDEYPIGTELIMKEGPVPSDYDQTFFWKVGYEGDTTRDGWCIDDFGPSPQG